MTMAEKATAAGQHKSTSIPADVEAAGLYKVGGRPPLGKYLAQVWQRREFIYALARFRIEAENGRNRLGMGWVVLKPMLNAAVYGLMFGVLLSTRKGIDNFVAYLIIGAFMIEYFSTCLNMGAKSITSNAALVQSLSFPRMSLPLALVVQRLMNFVPMAIMMFALAMLTGEPPTWDWLLFVPLILLFTVFNTGVALITARLTVHFRDLTQLLPFVARFIFYSSGVFFSIEDRLKDHPKIMEIVAFQPVHEFMTLARDILLSGPSYEISPRYFIYATGWSVLLVVVGTIFFWAAEERYGRTD